jgi:hypothetical protein
MEQAAETRGKTTFHFAVLVYQEEIAPGRTKWFARSLTTSDLGFGDTEREAIDDVIGAIDISIKIATSRGMSLASWLETQRPDNPRWIDEWIRLRKAARVERFRAPVDGCEIEACIAWKDAA